MLREQPQLNDSPRREQKTGESLLSERRDRQESWQTAISSNAMILPLKKPTMKMSRAMPERIIAMLRMRLAVAQVESSQYQRERLLDSQVNVVVEVMLLSKLKGEVKGRLQARTKFLSLRSWVQEQEMVSLAVVVSKEVLVIVMLRLLLWLTMLDQLSVWQAETVEGWSVKLSDIQLADGFLVIEASEGENCWRLQTEGAVPEQVKQAYTWHWLLQPSFALVFASSHCQPASMAPFPQLVTFVVLAVVLPEALVEFVVLVTVAGV